MVDSIGGKPIGKKEGPVHGAEPKPNLPAEKKDALGEAESHVVFARLSDEESKKPISGAKWEVLDEKGDVLKSGATDWQGAIEAKVPKAGKYTVQIVELPAGAELEEEKKK